MRSTWRSTRASSSAISRPGRLGERVRLPAHHHGPGPVGRRHDRAGGADHGRREPRRGGAPARHRERRDPTDPARADAPPHRGHARAFPPRRQRRGPPARGVGLAPGSAPRVQGGEPRPARPGPHRGGGTPDRWGVAVMVCGRGWARALARGCPTGGRPTVLAVAAVGMRLQSNFEHLNVTPILLGLIVATAVELEQGREARAGGWLGLARAIKGFPALVFLYFLVRRRWRGLAAGLAVAAGLTVAAMLPYGPVGAVESLARWLRLSQQGTTLGRMGTQSLAGFAFFFNWPSAC